MIDKTHLEELALAAVLSPLGEIAIEIGLDKSLSDYTREEALTLIEVAVSAYQKYKDENSPVPDPIAQPTITQPTEPQSNGVLFNASSYA